MRSIKKGNESGVRGKGRLSRCHNVMDGRLESSESNHSSRPEASRTTQDSLSKNYPRPSPICYLWHALTVIPVKYHVHERNDWIVVPNNDRHSVFFPSNLYKTEVETPLVEVGVVLSVFQMMVPSFIYEQKKTTSHYLQWFIALLQCLLTWSSLALATF